MKRTLRISLDLIAMIALIALFAVAIQRGWHWMYWRIPVLTLAIYLFSWTLERFPERGWVHMTIVVARVVLVLGAFWAEFQLPR